MYVGHLAFRQNPPPPQAVTYLRQAERKQKRQPTTGQLIQKRAAVTEQEAKLEKRKSTGTKKENPWHNVKLGVVVMVQ